MVSGGECLRSEFQSSRGEQEADCDYFWNLRCTYTESGGGTIGVLSPCVAITGDLIDIFQLSSGIYRAGVCRII